MARLTKEHKDEIKRINECMLQIHWWNHGTKTLDFRGTIAEYLKKYEVKIRFKVVDGEGTYKRLFVTVKNDIGNMKIKFTNSDYEDAIKHIIFQKLSYLGDKAIFSFNNKAFSNNYHR